MPGMVGFVQVINISNSGVFNIGDIYKVCPYSVAKTFAGSGSFNTGNGLTLYNSYSSTNTYDQDGIDQPTAFTL